MCPKDLYFLWNRIEKCKVRKMCFSVSYLPKIDYFKAGTVLAMTIRSIPCIFRLSAIFFQLSPLSEHCVKLTKKVLVTLIETEFPASQCLTKKTEIH